jgi:hypothetical protein
MSAPGPELESSEDPLQQLKTLRLGLDDPIGNLTDVLDANEQLLAAA